MKLLVGLTAAILTFAAFAATPYRTEGMVLLQPEFVLKERVTSIESLAGYVKAVQSSAGEALSDTTPTPASGYLVLAVRPGGQSMVWLDFNPALPEPVAARLRTAILAVPAFEARNGVVVFALKSSLWGAPPAKGFPDPPEWSKAMEGRDEPMEIGDLVDKVWPGRTGT